jgi:hypothetical protein
VSAWTFADAWVFASIAGSGPADGSSLTQIVMYADALNHALLMEDEFTDAFGRLRAAGAVEADVAADRYWLTDKGSVLRAEAGYQGLRGWTDAVPRALRSLGDPVDAPWSLPAGVFDQAVRDYLVS